MLSSWLLLGYSVINTLPITNCSRKSQNERKKVRHTGGVFLNFLQSTQAYKWFCFPIFRDTSPKWQVLPRNSLSSLAFHSSGGGRLVTAAHRHRLCANLTHPARASSPPTPGTGAQPSCLCLLASQVKAKEGMVGKPR